MPLKFCWQQTQTLVQHEKREAENGTGKFTRAPPPGAKVPCAKRAKHKKRVSGCWLRGDLEL